MLAFYVHMRHNIRMDKTLNVGEQVWLKMPSVDDDCWVSGIVVKINPKTIRCYNEVRDMEGNYAVHNVERKIEE